MQDNCGNGTSVLGKRRRFMTTGIDPFSAGILPSSSTSRRRYLSKQYGWDGFEHSTDLVAHFGCVNALGHSKGDGRWLASAGDDQRILIWDTFSDLCTVKPSMELTGHNSNVFTISFSADNTRLFSGGNDTLVLIYDVEVGTAISSTHSSYSSASNKNSKYKLGRPLDVKHEHDSSVLRVDAHPFHPHLFLSCSQDGSVRQYDLRAPLEEAQVLWTHKDEDERSEFHDALYVTCGRSCGVGDQILTAGNNLLLHDTRTCFTSSQGSIQDRCILKYTTTYFKRNDPKPVSPSLSSLAIHPTRPIFISHLLKRSPTLFYLQDPIPIAQLEGDDFADRCTTKHGSFGMTGDKVLYGSGSDNFETFIWEIPEVANLLQKREESEYRFEDADQNVPQASSSATNKRPSGEVVFGAQKNSGLRYKVPSIFSSFKLTPHRSIVNNVLFHPSLPYVFTSGIEKRVVAHSPLAFDNPVSTWNRAKKVSGDDDDVVEGVTGRRRRRVFQDTTQASLFAAAADMRWDNEGSPDFDTQSARLATGGGGCEDVRTQEDESILEYFDALVHVEMYGSSEGPDWASTLEDETETDDGNPSEFDYDENFNESLDEDGEEEEDG